jgi:hypothetical protein
MLSSPTIPCARQLATILMWPLIGLLMLFSGPAGAQSDSFVFKGRQVELVAPGPEAATVSRASRLGAEQTITLRDVASGQLRVYASGLVLRLRKPAELPALLRENPALRLQIAPGDLAYVSVDASQLPALFRHLSQDARVVEVQLRVLQPPFSPS